MDNALPHPGGWLNTVLVMTQPGPLLAAAVAAAARNRLRAVPAVCVEDLLARPAFLAIVDPDLLCPRDWTCWRECLEEAADARFRVLLVGQNPHAEPLPAATLCRPPDRLDVDALTWLMLTLRSRLSRRTSALAKKERQLHRLMYALKTLDSGGHLRTSDIAREFDVTTRTAQRDIETLAMAGYLVMPAGTTGTYAFPRGYRAYEIGIGSSWWEETATPAGNNPLSEGGCRGDR